MDKKIEDLLNGCILATEIDEFVNKISSGIPLKVKYGIDPTSPHVHLGHTVPLRILKRFQEAGHEANIIIGDFTAGIGDPSGRNESRPSLTFDQIRENMTEYVEQISNFIDISKTKLWYNSSWLWGMKLYDLIQEFSYITVQQMTNRKDFSKRIKDQIPVYLNELIYPVIQSIDSRRIKADVEIGGTEQLYTLLLARDIQVKAKQKPQSCILAPILRGTDGKKRMGKSLGNFIGVNEPPLEIFGKTMSIPDSLLDEWIELLTEPEVIPDRSDPYRSKLSLSENLVTQCYNQELASTTRKQWLEQFSEGKDPEIIREVKINPGVINICNLLVALGLCNGTSEARRLITPTSCVTLGIDRTKITNPSFMVDLQDGLIIRVGKKRVARIITH